MDVFAMSEKELGRKRKIYLPPKCFLCGRYGVPYCCSKSPRNNNQQYYSRKGFTESPTFKNRAADVSKRDVQVRIVIEIVPKLEVGSQSNPEQEGVIEIKEAVQIDTVNLSAIATESDQLEVEEYLRKQIGQKEMEKQRCESQVVASNQRIQLLEENLKKAEKQLLSATAKLEEVSRVTDVNERARQTTEDKLLTLEEEVKEYKVCFQEYEQLVSDMETQYEKLAGKLSATETKLELADEKINNYDRKVRMLESMQVHLSRSAGSDDNISIKDISDEDILDKEKPTVKIKKSPPRNKELTSLVKKLVKSNDLTVVTTRSLMEQIYAMYPSFDLSDRKDFIRKEILACI